MRCLLAMMVIAASPAVAQPPAPAEVRIQQVAPGVAILFGRGGNVGLSYGEDGNVLIDDQYAPMAEPILAAVRSLGAGQVRFVINTHWHGDHTGGNEYFGGSGSVIVAHDNVRRRMSMEQVVRGQLVAASTEAALPVLTFGQDISFHLNGDEIRVHHVPPAHTDGDSLVYWTRANVLHMGDIYFNGMLPFIDLDSGGSADGVIGAVERALAIANERTVIVPGHGPLATKKQLSDYRDMLRDIRHRVAQAIQAGQTLDQIKALRLADRHGRESDFISPDSFIETMFRSLTPAGPTMAD